MKSEHEPSPHCLDAETMAAWVDHALPAAEAAAADAHVADCARCQAVLAVLVKTLPAAAQPVPWWRRGWALGTLVPLAGGALAIAVWVATPRQPAPPAVTTPAMVTSTTSAALPASPASTPSPAIAPAPPAAAPTLTAEPPRAQAPALSERIAVAPVPAPAARAGSAEAPARAEARDEPAARATAEQLRRADAAPAAAPVAPASQGAAPPAEARQAMPVRALATLNKIAAGVDVVSPDPSVRWRIGAAGSILRSADGGATWTPQASGVAQDLTAGTSPLRGICWVVGRAGTVLLFTDGNPWRRVEFPETVDLTRVDARDALIATVTAADGRRFQTTDGGRTWARLQDF